MTSRDKYTKNEADYGPGKPEHHCGKLSDSDIHYCRHFSNNACKLVAGPIDAEAGCRFFARQQKEGK